MILKHLTKHVLADIEAGNSVILRSSSGRGKSEFCQQLFDTLKASSGLNWGFQSLFLATQTPPDLIGYQFKGEGEFGGRKFTKSEASLPLWMVSTEGKPAWAYDRFFLVLDEYGQGESDVKRSSAELFLKGEIGPWALPPYSVRIACTNCGPRYGVTKDFDFVINRQSRYDVTDDLESWLEWASKPYMLQGREWAVQPVTKAFATSNPQILFEPEPKEQGPWCTPRALCAVDRYVQTVARMSGGNVNPSDPGVCEGVAGKIGVASAGAYMGHLQFLLELPQYGDVVANPDSTPTPSRPDMMMLMAYQLASLAKKEHLHAVIQYMQRMPKDLAITFVRSLIARDKSTIVEPAMTKWVGKNATLLSLLEAAS